MTFAKVENIVDGCVLLEKNGELFSYCSATAEVIRRLTKYCFQNIKTGEEIILAYASLRMDSALNVRYI